MRETANERFHRLLFFAVQRLRGRPIGQYIRKLQEWERLEPEAFQRLRHERLTRTLEYARSRVPHYRSGAWRQALQRDPLDLRSWPVLEREEIQANGPDLLAQPIPSGHYFRLTSGSTGNPLAVGVDADGAAWAWASDYRGLLWHGISVGALALKLRHVRESVLAEWIRNQKLLWTGDLSPANLTEAVRFLETARPRYTWGYVSTITELARHARVVARPSSGPLVPFVMVLGEMLYPSQRAEIEEALGARVIETYGCCETGTVAYECPAGSLHVFAEHVEVEILEKGKPVVPGEVGDIILTCTTNRVMPLVRYRVGDRGRLSPEPCACGRPHPVIAGIEGRIADMLFTAAGGRTHGALLGGLLKRAIATAPPTAMRHVLFDQHDLRTWTVLVQPGAGFGDNTAIFLADGVREIFGQECEVTVKLVPEIPREASGKFRFYRPARIVPASPGR
jgi:phenylacetate-CoA ligase